jgi:hypothetical protein
MNDDARRPHHHAERRADQADDECTPEGWPESLHTEAEPEGAVTALVSHSIKPLMMKMNRPSVTRMRGNVRTFVT